MIVSRQRNFDRGIIAPVNRLTTYGEYFKEFVQRTVGSYLPPFSSTLYQTATAR